MRRKIKFAPGLQNFESNLKLTVYMRHTLLKWITWGYCEYPFRNLASGSLSWDVWKSQFKKD